MDSSVVRRLERLESDMEGLRQSMESLQYEEMKRTVVKQVQDVLAEYKDVEVCKKVKGMGEFSECSKRAYCSKAITTTVEKASLAYLRDDVDTAFSLIDEMEMNIRESDGCEAGDCRGYAIALVGEVRSVFTVAERLRERLDVPLASEPIDLDPDDVANTLGPLAHPSRIRMLMVLKDGDCGFADLSRELGMRTGHLQFHIKTLMEAGYVRRGSNRGTYGITLRGVTALDGLERLLGTLINP